MDNLKAATEQMEIIREAMQDEETGVTFSDLIRIAHFYVMFDIAETLIAILQVSMEDR